MANPQMNFVIPESFPNEIICAEDTRITSYLHSFFVFIDIKYFIYYHYLLFEIFNISCY